MIIKDFIKNKIPFIFSLRSLEENFLLEDDFLFFESWLKKNAHASMTFLERNHEARKNLNLILKNPKTAFIVLFPYSGGHRIRGQIISNKTQVYSSNDSLIAKKLISKYVYSKDYHKVIQKSLHLIAQNLEIALGHSIEYRCVVDSIPFFDRAHARESGLGFIGKNTMLIRPGMGSFFFIGTLLTNISINELCTDSNTQNVMKQIDCRSCNLCLKACPTQALKEAYFLDANRCLSYLTIEHRDIVSNEFLPYFSSTIYGCDICQDHCPYNFVTTKFLTSKEFEKLHEPFTQISVAELACMSKIQYERWFGGTAATRAKYEGIIRNALYHLFATRQLHLLKEILNHWQKTEYPLIQKVCIQLCDLLNIN